MEMYIIAETMAQEYKSYLIREERSPATVQKYLHDITAFYSWLSQNCPPNGGAPNSVSKETVITYKGLLAEQFAISTVNGALAALNGFFSYLGYFALRVKPLKKQRALFCPKEKELSKAEYMRLLKTANSEGNQRLLLLMETICSTGIRVSELRFITAEAAAGGSAEVNCKGKRRTVFLPRKLCKLLTAYSKKNGIRSGSIFVTRSGTPMNRSNIWAEMKRLCRLSGVDAKKVFPHNLRHLFARTFYSLEKDIAKLADLLGHSSIDTTRIYIVESGAEHQRQMARLHLLI